MMVSEETSESELEVTPSNKDPMEPYRIGASKAYDQMQAEAAKQNPYKEAKRLAKEADIDHLTGLLNRRGFENAYNRVFETQRRNRGKMALLALDLDLFKKVNDLYGHPIGDKVLKQLAETLKQKAGRTIDIIARMGGEEFAIVLPATDLGGAEELARGIRDLYYNKQLPENTGIDAGYPKLKSIQTLSTGIFICDFSQRDYNQSELMPMADLALYRAKEITQDNRLEGVTVDRGAIVRYKSSTLDLSENDANYEEVR